MSQYFWKSEVTGWGENEAVGTSSFMRNVSGTLDSSTGQGLCSMKVPAVNMPSLQG